MNETRKILFLGYPFALDYVRPAVEAAAGPSVDVIVASDVLRGKPLLHKIEDLMREADLCLFDLTLHNANVACEFGIAHGRGYKYAILYCTDEASNPKPGTDSSVFSDVKGWDSVIYADPLDLETQLRRYLPELLQAPKPAESAPMHIRRAEQGNASIRPRLNLKVKTDNPGFIAVNDGPVTKFGSYHIAFELENAGKGVANDVRVSATGMEPIQRFQALPVGAKNGVTFKWNLEQQPAFQSTPQFPAVLVEYEDDEGVKYEQRAALNAQKNGYGYEYEGQGLSAPRPISDYSVT